MSRLIWRFRYALHAWRLGMDWKTSWYSAGVSATDEYLDSFWKRDPIEDAETEVYYARMDG